MILSAWISKRTIHVFFVPFTPNLKGMMKMEEKRNDTIEVLPPISAPQRKQILVAAIVLAVLIFGNMIFNLYETYYESAASLTFFYGVLHIAYEWLRAMICIVILYGLISFIIHFRKGVDNHFKGLTAVISALWFHLVIRSFSSIFYIGALESAILSVLTFVLLFGYTLVLTTHLQRWVNYRDLMSDNSPKLLWISIFVIGFTLFLIFHYFYMQYGGNYGVTAHKTLFLVNTPFLKIALMLLLQTALMFVISAVHPVEKKPKSLRLIPMVLAGVVLVVLIAMGIIESSVSHYRFRVLENEPTSQIEIQVANGTSSITPLAFYGVINEVTVDPGSLDDYMRLYDFDPLASLYEIPSIDAKLIVTMDIVDNTLVDQIYVYDENQNRVEEINDWFQLDTLDPGTYYVLVQLSTSGDPYVPYADYLFRLTVS
jgi:hypothetical protein